MAKTWDSLRTRGLTTEYERKEMDPQVGDDVEPDDQLPAVSEALFDAKLHDPDFNLKGITEQRTWPAFTPQTSCVLAANRELLLECGRSDRWGVASHSWLSSLVPVGTVVQEVNTEAYFVSLGSMGGVAAAAWPLTKHTEPTDGKHFFTLDVDEAGTQAFKWLFVLGLYDYQVVPTCPQAPAHTFLGAKI